MGVSVEVHKILKFTICDTVCFFYLLQMELLMKNRVKHPHKFLELMNEFVQNYFRFVYLPI